jgi:hypothetical protein
MADLAERTVLDPPLLGQRVRYWVLIGTVTRPDRGPACSEPYTVRHGILCGGEVFRSTDDQCLCWCHVDQELPRGSGDSLNRVFVILRRLPLKSQCHAGHLAFGGAAKSGCTCSSDACATRSFRNDTGYLIMWPSRKLGVLQRCQRRLNPRLAYLSKLGFCSVALRYPLHCTRVSHLNWQPHHTVADTSLASSKNGSNTLTSSSMRGESLGSNPKARWPQSGSLVLLRNDATAMTLECSDRVSKEHESCLIVVPLQHCCTETTPHGG